MHETLDHLLLLTKIQEKDGLSNLLSLYYATSN